MGEPLRVDRRTTLKWILAASAALPALERAALAGAASPPTTPPRAGAVGYGSDPDLLRAYAPGDVWPLTFSPGERRAAAALADAILPKDAASPAASDVGVVDFIDEWVSAPYPAQQEDRRVVLAGLAWLDAESQRRFGHDFADLDASSTTAICDEICYAPRARPALAAPARFFARFRDLTAAGFYTTPEGMRDLRYVGNVALPRFDGPPGEVLRRVGLEAATAGEPG
jgi:hypothetical protein